MQDKLSVFVLDKNENSREIVKSYLAEAGYDVEVSGDYSILDEVLAQKDKIVIMDISAGMIDELTLKTIAAKLIVTSIDYSTDMIVKALRCGAKEFLPKPVIKEDLLRAMERVEKAPDEDVDSSKIIAVYSNKGGIGKTTIAVNLATELAKVTKDKVALVDLNLQLGDVATFLNLTPAFDVNYVIRRLVNGDEKELIQFFEKYKESSLYILADPSYIEQSESITPQQIVMLFKVLRKVFPYVVIDMSSNIDGNSLKILDCADWILFTTIVNIPAIRNAQRCLNLFHSRRYSSDKVKIVVNRYMENDEIKVEDIENTLGEKIYWKIPNNYFTIMEAINKGVSISEVNTNSNIANNFRDFASKVSGDIIEQSIVGYRS